MAEPVILSRDVGRNQLPGLDLPSMQIELGEPCVDLCNEDFKSPSRTVAGIVSISPISVAWYDGTLLSLSSLTLTVQAPARGNSKSSHPAFFQQGSYDLTLTARSKRFDPDMWADDHGQCIQFGSTFTDRAGGRCPIALRIPMAACVPGGTRLSLSG
ncbi:hypothetical protein M407DRAFT_222609 [Tulasnella calospora MUT 4182]|uniref:Uncharacterized protein n=1 Tax=Tulasnella calospora MUT 4182 TaxID=1051891 RepID=A0A0C3Q7P1_9AGAM|nr:hypothetical protein M407DRAFT_222609 [Tulasnella calospora MUT 4182]